MERTNERITREKHCQGTNVTQPPVILRPWTLEEIEVDCDLSAPENLTVVNDLAVWDPAPWASAYQLRWRQGEGEWTTQNVSEFETKYRLDALDRNVAYELQIQTLGAGGQSAIGQRLERFNYSYAAIVEIECPKSLGFRPGHQANKLDASGQCQRIHS